MIQTTVYSHAFFIGVFNGKLTPDNLQKCNWEHVIISNSEYQDICSQYYEGHVDAMLERETDNLNKPEFLHAVSHFVLKLEKQVTLQVPQKDSIFSCNFSLCNLHLYFMPLDIVFLAFEIDDSGIGLDDLTFAHFTLSIWKGLFEKKESQDGKPSLAGEKKYVNQDFLSAFDSLKKFLPDNNLENLLGTGNKFKIFQMIQVEAETVKDELLYELGTCSPIGCVGGDNYMTPSEDYYNKIIAQNTISAFKNWKSLALMDSLTMLSNAPQRWGVWYNLYFPLIYLRCLFEKTYCFSRNTAYRRNESAMNISKEISQMEQYYFYNSISYNFLPNLLYKKIAKGLELKEERKELAEQIKERAEDEETRRKEKRDEKSQTRLALISVFAIFSIAWDLCCILTEASFWNRHIVAVVCLVLGIMAILIFNTLIFRNKL